MNTEQSTGKTFQPDESQRQVINAEGGYHLVLAPPGCGKTQILTERIRRAHQRDGVSYDDMLCLTFTNRAARGMIERIRENIDDSEVGKVYVGNVHRFCSKFLFENNVIPAETSIIDDDDAISIVARYLDEDEMKVMENAKRRREYFDVIHFSHLMQQLRTDQPSELRLHPECCNSNDIASMQKICQVQRMTYDKQAMLDIYDHIDFYQTATRMEGYDLGSQVTIGQLLNKMTIAQQYEKYKRENHLVDFEDLLIMTYDSLSTVGEGSQETQNAHKKYRWIQVDEVQDLNPLQLAIIDLITAVPAQNAQQPSPTFTVIYLGDEQQAIFSFMGARLSTLNALRQRCEGHLHHLSTNHRSPQYLLEVYNEYARNILGIDTALLPKAASPRPSPKGEGAAILQAKVRPSASVDRYDLLKDSARKMRKDSTQAESFLWEHIRDNALKVKFRRQHPIGDYIVDFICIEEQLIIEVDGGYHQKAEQQEWDKQRTDYLEHVGYRIIRFSNEEVLFGINQVLTTIKSLLKAPSLLGEGRGEAVLRILRSNTLNTEFYDVAHQARLFQKAYPDETTAIIVNSNADADTISAELQKMEQPHFKVSGEDLFATREMKLLLAHLNVLANEHNFIAWARLIKGFNVTASNAYARNLVQSLRQRSMLPNDFLLYDDCTYLEEFVKAYAGDIVVFDTETTGLDVCNDEIVQIAAVRMRQGQIIEGSDFNVYLQTTRPIPQKLGDIDNPILEELKNHELLPPQEGLQCFLDYVGNSTLLGHNAMFDWQMLKNNIKRALPSQSGEGLGVRLFDSLKLIRLLAPDLRQYKLKYLLSVLGLEGENSHLADADVAATCSLVRYCYTRAQQQLEEQRKFRAQSRVKERAEALRRSYRNFYRQALSRLYDSSPQTVSPLLKELQLFHDYLVKAGVIEPISKLHYVLRYLEEELLDPTSEHTLSQQLAAHIIEINTLKEADLCNSHSIDDRIFVSTVHKAKGLEFDNVIVFDAVEDRYPSYYNRNNKTAIAEDARKFYVAITRARKRLYVSQCLTRIDNYNQPHKRYLTRFMIPIQKFFG